MKQYLIILCLLYIQVASLAQNNTGIADDFKYLAMHNMNVNTSTITSFNNNQIKGSQYLFEDWTSGSVTTTENITYSNKYLFNYDKVKQNLYLKYTEQAGLIILLDKSIIKTFTISNRIYRNATSVDPALKQSFYEILVADSNICLYKSTLTKFIKADPTNIMNVQTGNFASEFIDDVTYFVTLIGGAMKKINFSKTSIKKLLIDKSDKVDSYFNNHLESEIDEPFLIDMIHFLNK